MNKHQIINKLKMVKDKTLLIKVVQLIMTYISTYQLNDTVLYFNANSLNEETMKDINNILNEPIKTTKQDIETNETNEWYKMINKIIV